MYVRIRWLVWIPSTPFDWSCVSVRWHHRTSPTGLYKRCDVIRGRAWAELLCLALFSVCWGCVLGLAVDDECRPAGVRDRAFRLTQRQRTKLFQKRSPLHSSVVVADKPKSEGHTVCPSWLLTGTVNNLSVCPLAELVDRVSPSWWRSQYSAIVALRSSTLHSSRRSHAQLFKSSPFE